MHTDQDRIILDPRRRWASACSAGWRSPWPPRSLLCRSGLSSRHGRPSSSSAVSADGFARYRATSWASSASASLYAAHLMGGAL